MPKSKFEQIYKDLKEKIESGDYAYQDLLPSENTMVSIYNCSRNTIRRALSELTEQGYVQPLHGKGVRVIYQRSIRQLSQLVGLNPLKNLQFEITENVIQKSFSLLKSLLMNVLQPKLDFQLEANCTISNVSDF